MASGPFEIPFERLPATLPIFPLPNAVVMPGCQLPLNIFEPRYLNMVFDALGSERLIGMVQPDAAGSRHESVYRTGTAGRISFFNETADGRLMIVLSGVCRFDISREFPTTRGYRRAAVDWTRFRGDYDELQPSHSSEPVIALLQDYFAGRNLDTDWKVLANMNTVDLVNRLTCVLPLEVAERQALVEAVSADERTRSLITLLRCETVESAADSSRRH